MKQLLAIIVVVLFSSPAWAHIPDNCRKHLTEFEAANPVAEKLSQKSLQAAQNLIRVIDRHGLLSQEYIQAERHNLKVNREYRIFLVKRPKPLLFMIFCIDGHEKYQ